MFEPTPNQLDLESIAGIAPLDHVSTTEHVEAASEVIGERLGERFAGRPHAFAAAGDELQHRQCRVVHLVALDVDEEQVPAVERARRDANSVSGPDGTWYYWIAG